jgi:hypothetical protein
MAKFSRDKFPPGFFDLPQTAGETLPLDVIAAWTGGEQTVAAARAILAPHTLRGTLVSSDSAGLTRLTRERPLIEILALVNHPKELVHAYGRAIGGRAIGVWAADNTQMFYDADVSASQVLGMLLSAMRAITAECELGIGMAAHAGEFYELGGGVYGGDAERVEVIAEEHTPGGELLVTDAVVERLGAAHEFVLEARAGLPDDLGSVCRLIAGPALAGLDLRDTAYPAPYTTDFTSGLAEYSRTRRDSRAPNTVYRDLAVVLVEREAEEPGEPEVVVLNDLALTAAMKRISLALVEQFSGEEVKTAGRLGIYTFAEPAKAVEFARRFRDALEEQGVRCRVGIDAGPVLLFDLTPGSREIAGSPVNVASKLSQDVGSYGAIRISQEAARRAGLRRERSTLSLSVSGVELRAYDL